MNDPRTSTTQVTQTQPPPEGTPSGAGRCCRESSISPTACERGQSPPGLAFRMILAVVVTLCAATVAFVLAVDHTGFTTSLVALSTVMVSAVWFAVELALWRVTRVLSILADLQDKLDRHMMDTEIKLGSIRSMVRDIRDDQLMQKGDNK